MESSLLHKAFACDTFVHMSTINDKSIATRAVGRGPCFITAHLKLKKESQYKYVFIIR